MTATRRWEDLTRQQRLGIGALGVVQLALLAAALWDLRHRDADEIRGNRRWWTAGVFVNWIGPISYFLFGRRR